MFNTRNNVRNCFTPFRRLCRPSGISSLSRTAAYGRLDPSQLEPVGPVAKRLAASEVWAPSRTGRRGRVPKSEYKADKTRVNIVSGKLCDHIFNYVGSTLKQHAGCDIIDIYPGAGIWSKKLHEFLKPRSHILMEPDAQFYEPFLKPLLDMPNTTLVPESGFIWRELNSILTPDYLPHQTVPDPARLTQRNDTLLVTANLVFHPKKRFLGFESLASLVLYQFIEAIRVSGLFQKYGLVRMLIWCRPDDKFGLLPKVMQKRRKLAIDGELACEWIREMCGPDAHLFPWYIRDSLIDEKSNLDVWKRMQASKFKIHPDRVTEGLREARQASKSGRQIKPGIDPPVFKRPFLDVLDELEEEHSDEVFVKGSDKYTSMQRYRWRANWEDKKHERMVGLLSGLDAITALYKSGRASPEEIEALEKEWMADLVNNPKGFITEFTTYKDNLHYFRQSPPLLHWDRRAYEPMTVRDEEFFPNIPCSLLDIQPKEVHPLLRQTGPNSNRAGDCFDVILSSMMTQSTQPVGRNLDALMPGAADYIMPRWKSARDLKHGGVVVKNRFAELTPRMLNARQWEELLELWMEWPFRPELHELVSRTHGELPTGDSTSASEA